MITDPIWYKGLALSERLQALKAQGRAIPKLPQGASEVADRRMQRWLAQEPFEENAIFAQRLAMDAIDAEEFRSLLVGEVEKLAEDCPLSPVWANTLEQAFSAHVSDQSMQVHALPEQGNRAFLAAFTPVITQHRAKLLVGIEILTQNYPAAPFVPQEVESAFWENNVQHLTNIVSRTMVLELQVARLQGILHGATPEERFQSFIQHISQEHVGLALLKEYPVLARVLTACLASWVEASLELVTRLCADWEAILDVFATGENPGLLVKIQTSGDRHRRERAVALLDFSTGFRLVYKPKSLDADENFQAWLRWLNERGQQPELRPTRMLNRGSYGWCEFLLHQPCSSSEEVARFYQREGGLLALLYLLAATDFHYENIIAVGEHPMLVDYESLFHPAIRSSPAEEASPT
ncbi:MAG: type 2 lanthipeptide synthetase LanM, partial [Ktedonobacteraceae bacterium]